jgi:hypothetical protein
MANDSMQKLFVKTAVCIAMRQEKAVTGASRIACICRMLHMPKQCVILNVIHLQK